MPHHLMPEANSRVDNIRQAPTPALREYARYYRARYDLYNLYRVAPLRITALQETDICHQACGNGHPYEGQIARLSRILLGAELVDRHHHSFRVNRPP